MAEKLSPKHATSFQNNGYDFDKDPLDCGLEGVRNRPEICPNNPWRFPEKHKIEICRKCSIQGVIFDSQKYSNDGDLPDNQEYYNNLIKLPLVYALVKSGVLKIEDLKGNYEKVTQAIRGNFLPYEDKVE